MMSLYQIVEGCKLGARAANKTKIATHMEFKQYPNYISVSPMEESRLLKILAQNHETGTPSFIHECFDTDAFALVFDIDGEPGAKTIDQILKPMYAAVREIFETRDESIFNCVIFTASSENKMSYHIHWPDIIVDKHIMEQVYNTVFRSDNSMRDFIDFQIIKSCKLRMAFSDKWDHHLGGGAGRKLQYAGAYNNNGLAGRRYTPEWEQDTYETLLKSRVRRSEGTQKTQLFKKVSTIESAITSDLTPIDFDFGPHDESDFLDMPPEFYTVTKMQYVIRYLEEKYKEDVLYDRIVVYMNNFVSMITDHPGKTIFVIRKHIADGGKQQWKYIQKGKKDFLEIMEHVKVELQIQTRNKKGEKESKSLTSTIGQIWMTHPKRKSYSTIVFNPDPFQPLRGNDLNLYQGLRVTYPECENVVHTQLVDYMAIIKPILNDEFSLKSILKISFF